MISLLGANGFIGQSFVHYLNQNNQKYQILKPNSPELFSKNSGTLIYFIGMTGDYLKNPFQTVEAHVSLLSRILEKASFEYFIYFSSTRLYDFILNENASITTPISFLSQEKTSLYILSKALGENLSLLTHKAAVLRLSNVYDFSNRKQGFLNVLLNQIKEEKEIILPSSPLLSRNYLFMEDLMRILDFFILNRPHGIFNVASPKNTTNLELKNLFKEFGFSLHFTENQKNHLPSIDISFLNEQHLTPRETLENLRDYFLKQARSTQNFLKKK